MSVKRSRTSTHNGEKIRTIYEYGLDELAIYVSYGNTIYVRYAGPGEYVASSKLLKLFFKLLDMDIPQIEKTLGVKISSNGITDKAGNQIDVITL